MSNLRTICRPHGVFFSSSICCRYQVRSIVSFRNPNNKPRYSLPSFFSPLVDSSASNGTERWFRVNQRRTLVKAANWTEPKSPYETLGNFVFFDLTLTSFSGPILVIELKFQPFSSDLFLLLKHKIWGKISWNMKDVIDMGTMWLIYEIEKCSLPGHFS